ncbi:ArsR/SmtB family transcription factor [Actinoplanes friuliensis]|uniref:ArsR family transcriptional regulator n=1 Tax=Actinoplanes friuliensis DSM 7358 TaxID=1246995 RepID=U5WFD4_9ACTN|nr:helix-turn-helix domain-containing protein [Actinoplanes friuliensis]AGZ46621.1 ArsR family transcriptional regulator [Actinoplanes friuliensis DSM 7358]
MSLTNPFGDLQVTDPQAMRALAHPVRLAILSFLQRNGPATATVLSPHVGATPSVTSWHLRHLAGFGLVTDADPDEVPGDRRQRWWKAKARGFSVSAGEDPESTAAARVLGNQLAAVAQQQVSDWVTDVAPGLPGEWARASGISNTSVPLTSEELTRLSAQIDELIAPYVHRAEADAPAGARVVRILRHYLPSASDLGDNS